jgi:hypothetical protein
MPPITKKQERTVLFPEVEAKIYSGESGLTAATAKSLLGWAEVDDKAKNFQITDRNGKKIVLTNDDINRPIYSSIYESLAQEMLQKRWRLNGETIIIGKTGRILDGQHTLIALVLAEQDRLSEKEKDHWVTLWGPGAVTVDKIVVLGVEESNDVVNTINTCKPRSLSDVVYRSEFFAKMKPDDRKLASKITATAVKVLWDRTGAKENSWIKHRNHSESLDFIGRHQRILRAVKHVMEENADDPKKGEAKSLAGTKLSRFMNIGYVAAACYLMAAGKTDPKAYHEEEAPSEKRANFDLWDTSCEFWSLMAGQAKETEPIRLALARQRGQELADEDEAKLFKDYTGTYGRFDEKLAILGKAWEKFVANPQKPVIKPADLDLSSCYKKDEEGVEQFSCGVTFGGIDIGKEKKEDVVLTEEEVAAAKKAEDEAKAKKREEHKAKLAANRAAKGKPTTADITAQQTAEAAKADAEAEKMAASIASPGTAPATSETAPVPTPKKKSPPKPIGSFFRN